MSQRKKIIILGGGATGLTVGWKLAESMQAEIVLLEQQPTVGGLATTFTEKDIQLDIGSHRIHEQYDPQVFRIIQGLLGKDLLKRPRKGLILIRDMFLKYPPSILQILKAFGGEQSSRFVWDYIRANLLKLFPHKKGLTFEDYTIQAVGRSLYESFYKPYAWKLWGRPPNAISFEPARNRVKKFELKVFLREVAARLFPMNPAYFYYPAGGIGQITDRLKDKFLDRGGRIETEARITKIYINQNRRIHQVDYESPSGEVRGLQADLVISTIPLDTINRLIKIPDETNPIPFQLKWRSLRLLYLRTFDKIESENETFYLPEPEFKIGRISDINKYSPVLNSAVDGSILTLEFPCDENDGVWNMSEQELFTAARTELRKLGILKSQESKAPIYFSRKIKNLYPVYEIGWKKNYEEIIRRLDSVPNLFLIGRAGLFLHCNIDHCMTMALKLAELLPRSEDKNQWKKISKSFERFQVKD